MKPTVLLSALLIATGVQAEESPFILPFVPVESEEKEAPVDEEISEEEVPAEDVGEETTEEEVVPEIIEDPAPVDWFPGGWNPDWVRRDGGPDIYYTMGGVEEDPELHPYDPLPDVDPVIYQTGIPAGPKLSRKEKKAALAADIAEGCEVTFDGLDGDADGSLTPEEFSLRRPGSAKGKLKAFRRADRDRSGLLSVAEFCAKGDVPLVVPAPLNVLEAADARATFNTLDFDGNGFLTFGEFTAVLRPSGPGVLEAIFAEADRNGDGKISFAEYTHRQVRPAGVE
jgi:Ca2+-binding EF-hand superfamily protein